jgi:hypothetical protein
MKDKKERMVELLCAGFIYSGLSTISCTVFQLLYFKILSAVNLRPERATTSYRILVIHTRNLSLENSTSITCTYMYK